MLYSYEIETWRDGELKIAAAEPKQRRLLESLADTVAAELRRRLGGPFTVSELVELYRADTDWCLELTIATAPDHPEAWSSSTVTNAAFARYVREAIDFSGGRVAF